MATGSRSAAMAPSLHGDPRTVEDELVYLIEKPDGTIEVRSPSDFEDHPRAGPYAQALTAADHDRQVAEWVLSVDGIVKLLVGKEEIHVRKGETLPSGPFRLVGVFFTEAGRKENPTWINDDSLRKLDGLADLEMLRLSGTKVTDAGLAHVSQFRKLQMLDLWDTEVSDGGLEHLRVLQNLTSLTLNHTQVTDAGLQHLAALTRLKDLYLNINAGISDAGIRHLIGLKQLQDLKLGKTNITDAGLDSLGEIASLERLGLDGTKVTPSGVAKLQALLPKCEIVWDGK